MTQVSEAQLRLLAQLAGLEIAPRHMPGVISNLEILLSQAALLAAAPIEPLVEPAPVFHA
jgi:hypothetical protein